MLTVLWWIGAIYISAYTGAAALILIGYLYQKMLDFLSPRLRSVSSLRRRR